jgi:hypothetical protein
MGNRKSRYLIRQKIKELRKDEIYICRKLYKGSKFKFYKEIRNYFQEVKYTFLNSAYFINKAIERYNKNNNENVGKLQISSSEIGSAYDYVLFYISLQDGETVFCSSSFLNSKLYHSENRYPHIFFTGPDFTKSNPGLVMDYLYGITWKSIPYNMDDIWYPQKITDEMSIVYLTHSMEYYKKRFKNKLMKKYKINLSLAEKRYLMYTKMYVHKKIMLKPIFNDEGLFTEEVANFIGGDTIMLNADNEASFMLWDLE